MNRFPGTFSAVTTATCFLVKPTTEREDSAAKGEKLDWKGMAISLFFGLTIGFGTGFVGSGGGMMMLVVFTAFLGMELKVAVGTSTFIMTFTTLIASVSHIMIHPAILLEQWPVLFYCIAVAAILMCGSGDGVAALIGKRFGKHRAALKFADPKKIWEGSGSMAVVSTAVGTATMLVMTTMPYRAMLPAIQRSVGLLFTMKKSTANLTVERKIIPVGNGDTIWALWYFQALSA